ncbi:MAG: VOC family protein [Deltaproteobacteria bacterium]|nr:VOC family protein [Deltaproteobacteria bacterium]MBV8453318.1 VOC family protein [Deltaproteobacteria bacterium]
MPHGSINHLALTVSDLACSTAFYDRVLGLWVTSGSKCQK